MGKEGGSASQFRIILVLIIGIAVVILAAQNSEMVGTKFLMFEATMPRFALLLLTTGCGFVAGFLAGTMRSKRD